MAMDALSREQTVRPGSDRGAEAAEQPSKIASPRRHQQAGTAQAEKAELKVRELEAQLWVAEQKVGTTPEHLRVPQKYWQSACQSARESHSAP